MNRIIVYLHLEQPDYPWSVGRRLRRIELPATSDGHDQAEALTQRIRARYAAGGSRLLSFWRFHV